MLIEDYFREVGRVIEAHSVVRSFDVSYDKRSTHEGFIRGEVHFLDGSALHFREFVDVETIVERLAYSYHYQGQDSRLVFRYDNTGHHRKLNLPTYPHHKHIGKDDSVVASSAPALNAIMDEVESIVQLP